jgi:hypothetical protein
VKKTSNAWPVLAALAMTIFAAQTASAIPAYSAAYGQKCMLCHVSPTGGGMRSAYASQFLLPTELAFDTSAAESGGSAGANLSDQVSIGADLRTLFRYSPDAEHQASNNIFQMQGDLYLHFQMGERFSAMIEQGINGSYELFGTAFVLPAGGYVKVGRFVPAFGWRFADHGMFVRQEMGWSPPQHSDVGMELGFFPGKTSLSISLLNGSRGQVLDGDDRFAAALRGEWRHRLGPMNFALGASFYRDQESGSERNLLGPFYYFHLGRFSLIGELGLESVDGSSNGDRFAHSHELRLQVHRGLDLRFTYNYLDPDVDSQSGAKTKFGLGADLLATPFFGVLGMFNIYRFDEGDAVIGEDYAQAELVVHFLY